jgi:hypothetical protein
MGQTEFDGRCSAPGRARTCRQWRACATTRIQNQCPARARILDYQGDEHRSKVTAGRRGDSKDGTYRAWGEVHSPSPAIERWEDRPEPVKSAYDDPCGTGSAVT